MKNNYSRLKLFNLTNLETLLERVTDPSSESQSKMPIGKKESIYLL